VHITFTENAGHEIGKKADGRPFALKLIYEIEGCGCDANGIPTLRMISPDDAAETDEAVEGSPYPVYCDRTQAVYFEQQMRIDYRTERRSFFLDSVNQVYNTDMDLIDKRNVDVKRYG
jgi:uncharacterized protein YqkB